MIYMFLSNNPSSGDINSSNLPCLSKFFQSVLIWVQTFCVYRLSAVDKSCRQQGKNQIEIFSYCLFYLAFTTVGMILQNHSNSRESQIKQTIRKDFNLN